MDWGRGLAAIGRTWRLGCGRLGREEEGSEDLYVEFICVLGWAAFLWAFRPQVRLFWLTEH
jgi:hypothetical protein